MDSCLQGLKKATEIIRRDSQMYQPKSKLTMAENKTEIPPLPPVFNVNYFNFKRVCTRTINDPKTVI